MDLLTATFDPARSVVRPALLRGLAAVVACMAGALALAAALERLGGPGVDVGRAVGGAAVHGGFVALGWLIALEARPGWAGPALRLGGVALGAFLLSRLGSWGALALWGVPVALLLEAGRRPELARIGLGWPRRGRAVLVGAAAGVFLGAHLLLTATRTLGYPVGIASVGGYVALVSYDAGANAVSAEWLFRGALFSHWWRVWGFWVAVTLSTGMSLVRYLVDPSLPRTLEVAAGAVFYIALLGVASCALRAWSGSLLPGYVATVAFFLAYRALVV
jgi:hypothetical protein